VEGGRAVRGAGAEGRDEAVDGEGAGTFAEDGDARGVAAKGGDIALDPG